MKKHIKKVIAGLIVPAILTPSCSKSDYFINDDVENINKSMLTKTSNSIAVPINIKLDSRDQIVLDFMMKLIPDIIKNPRIAQQFATDPESIFEIYEIENININLDDGLWKLIIALGDEDIHSAVTSNDISLFFFLCDKKGLISELKESELIKNQQLLIVNEGDEEVIYRSGVMAAGVVVFVVTGGGCAVVGANSAVGYDQYVGYESYAIYSTETFWGPESSSVMSKRDPVAYQILKIKSNNEKTAIMLSEYHERMINECIEALQEHFPDKIQHVDMIKLRQLIALNLVK